MYINELESEFSCQDIPGANCAGFVAGWLTGWKTLVCHFSPSSSGKVTDDSGIPYWKCTDFSWWWLFASWVWGGTSQHNRVQDLQQFPETSQVKSLSLYLDLIQQCHMRWFRRKHFPPKRGSRKNYWYLLSFAWGPEKRRLKVLGLSDVESCRAGSGAKFGKINL